MNGYLLCTVMPLPVQQGESELENQKEIAVIKMREDLRDPSLPRAVILDLSPVNFLDTVGVKTIRNVRVDTSWTTLLDNHDH